MSDVHNLRTLVNEATLLRAQLRDNQLELIGIRAKVRYKLRDNVDTYGDPVRETMTTDYIWCLPLYEQYFKMLNFQGVSAESELPLEVRFKTTDFLPQNSELTLPPFRMPTGEFSEERVWHVKSTELKRTEETYENIAKCTPVREFADIETDEEEDILIYSGDNVPVHDDDSTDTLIDYGLPDEE